MVYFIDKAFYVLFILWFYTSTRTSLFPHFFQIIVITITPNTTFIFSIFINMTIIIINVTIYIILRSKSVALKIRHIIIATFINIVIFTNCLTIITNIINITIPHLWQDPNSSCTSSFLVTQTLRKIIIIFDKEKEKSE